MSFLLHLVKPNTVRGGAGSQPRRSLEHLKLVRHLSYPLHLERKLGTPTTAA